MKFDIGWLSGVSVFKFFEIFRYLDCYDAEDYIFYIRKDIEYDFNVLDEKLLMIKNIFEAKKIGTKYIISKYKLNSSSLNLIKNDFKENIFLYEIQ